MRSWALLWCVACGGSLEGSPPEGAPVSPDAVSTKVLEEGGITVRVLDPAGGPLDEQLALEAGLAQAAGKKPFVQIYGDWCMPCRQLRAAMGDPRMMDAFAGTWIVRVDSGAWSKALTDAPWVGEQYAVPSFYVLGEDGVPGASILGSAWGENTPANMAPPLKAFFRAHGALPTSP